MEIDRLPILLLLVQLSYIFAYVNGGAVYMCKDKQTTAVTVRDANAQLTNGCIQESGGITFDLKAMYDATRKTPKDPVVIEISQAAFINSYIKLINAHSITDISTRGPLLFRMSNSSVSGTSKLEFGRRGQSFKLPPRSRLRIIHCELIISLIASSLEIFTFHSLQLVTNSAMEIAHNVITVNHEPSRSSMYVFNLPTGMMLLDGSSLTLLDNNITMDGHSRTYVSQWVWFHGGLLVISDNSNYTWVSNIITMVAYNVSSVVRQYVCFHSKSSITISDNSNYTWVSNNISILAYDDDDHVYQWIWSQESDSFLTIANSSIYTWVSNIISIMEYNVNKGSALKQYVWSQDSTSPLTVSHTSNYKWLMNTISMDGYNFSSMYQYVWYGTSSSTTISAHSHLVIDSNWILLLAREYTATMSWGLLLTQTPPLTLSLYQGVAV